MDEIEYKLNTKNSVLVVNAIDKLITTIKLKFKPAERQRFVLENEELKYLREKCSSKEAIISLTACQGLLALVELGVLEIAHTMSTVVTLLPRAHNYSAIISTMSGLLVLDLKSRLVPGQPYKCQFSLKSPQHPFITVLERNKAAEDDVFAQMQALCTHPDYIVQSNSLELMRPVFLYLTCNPQQEGSVKPWQLMLSLPRTDAMTDLLLACLSCQQINSPSTLPRALAAYAAVTDAAIFQQDELYLAALMPMLAIISNRLVAHCLDPRPACRLLARCVAPAPAPRPALRAAAGLTLHVLASNISKASALSLHDTLALCLTILQNYDCPSLSVNALVAYTLQWLHQPSQLTTSALKIAAEIIDFYREKYKPNPSLDIPNLKSNKIFNYLANTDSKLIILVKLHSVYERIGDNPEKLKNWLDDIETLDKNVKLELLSFFYGLLMDNSEDIVLQVLKIVVGLVDFNKDVAVELMPILLYKIANDKSPAVKLECLRTLPLMAKTKENVPVIVSILNKLKANRGVPTSFLITLFATLADTQVRCFPYLQELLVGGGTAGRPDDLKWEVDVARIWAIKRICELRASSHGLELVPLISATLNRSSDRAGAVAAALALRCVAALWRAAALAPRAAWLALRPRLERDTRPAVQESICVLLSEVPALSSNTPEFHQLSRCTAGRLWRLLAEGSCSVASAAARALSNYSLDHYMLQDIPEIYRKTVKLPASYCKTPADAARKPEDVLDYIPCEIWPEVFKYTNQEALPGVVYFVRKLIEKEVGGFRSGMYQLEGGKEGTSYGHLPAASVLRGVMDYCRKQIMSPSHECPDVVTLAMLQALCSEYPKPLPPLEGSFLPELCSRGGSWRKWGVSLAARMAKVSPSMRAVVETWIQGIQNGSADESDIILFYELLPTFSRNFPPNTLRGPLERSLTDSFAQIANIKAKVPYEETLFEKPKINTKEVVDSDILEMESHGKEIENKEYLFVKQLKLVAACLYCDSIHSANRTLLAQLMEHYFAMIPDDNVAWPVYVDACTSLPAKYLERMTSPAGWWEVTATALRKAGAVRGAVAGSRDVTNPLYWLNEMIDAHTHEYTSQQFSLTYIFVSVRRAAATPEAKQWFLQLLARTQAAFKETEHAGSRRYLFAVVCTCAGALSGVWALTPRGARQQGAAGKGDALPAALSVLLAREGWGDCTLHVLEWLWHTRDIVSASEGADCQRALLALRHTEPFVTHKIWTRLESYFGKDIVQEC